MRSGLAIGAPVTAGGQRFIGAIGNGGFESSAAEATGAVPWPEAGTFSHLTMTIKSNAISGAYTKNMRFRKNTANGNQIVSATLGTLGSVTDISNSDSVVLGDRVGYLIGAGSGVGGGTVTYTVAGVTYTSTTFPDLSVVMLGAGSGVAANYSAGSARLTPPWGSPRWNGVNNEGVLNIRGISPVVSSLTISNSSSTATASTTFTSHINGSNGTQSVVIPASTTGYFQDLTNSEYVKPNDMITIAADSPGTGAVGVRVAAMRYRDITGFQVAGGSDSAALGGVTVTPGSTFYVPIAGSQNSTGTSTTETEVAAPTNITGLRVRNLLVYASANTATATLTAVLRIGGADSSQILTIPAGATGAFEDLSNSDSVSSSALLSVSYALAGGAGSVSMYKTQTTWVQPSRVWSQGFTA